MTEPRYSKAEQRERMAEFEKWVARARRDWRRGIAFITMSYKDYLKLDAPSRRRRTRRKG